MSQYPMQWEQKNERGRRTGTNSNCIRSNCRNDFIVIGEFTAPVLLDLLHTPEEIQEDATTYIRIYFISLLSLILYNIGAGILRACGDSASPFYILAVGGILNVLADAWLIAGLKLGV